ncbi:DUF721 domain-containing protein [Pyramidobacter sp.]|uniref:DUF721 domain-containing protein n=1 Tax=Pyramidobacter sp. TaxID=1943581 RepID=UPI0025E6CB11|nr:DUF721 domain-containing protein [Pyramidobacter sp.]MCI7404268.1 DUF721 domain-containing protein [Pyramidobacter sp.]MDY3212722.1 DUF721 domain-containing protein [Pyramidobacter sp.]
MAKDRAFGPRAVGSVIAHNLPSAFQVAFKLADMERQWLTIVGPQLFASTRPDRLERGELIVACESPAAAQMIKLSAGTLLRRVKKLTGLELPGVRAVVSRLERPRKKASAPPRRLQVSPEMVEEALNRVKATVKDPDTALSLARVEAAARARWGDGRKNEV